MRSIRLGQSGLWRLSRRTCELYSVMIVSSGAWGRFACRTGEGRVVFMQPSTFTGSFWLSGCCEAGLLVEIDSRDAATNLTIGWREPDARML